MIRSKKKDHCKTSRAFEGRLRFAVIVCCIVGLGIPVSTANAGTVAGGDIPPELRTADMPDSWLVVYNTNSFDSIIWANWYSVQWGIPSSHMFGHPMPLTEHLNTLEEVQSQVINPVRNYLDTHPNVKSKVMGIIVGYRVPGHYATPPFGGPGGFSVADAFKDLTDDTNPPALQKGVNNAFNPWFATPRGVLPAGGRLTKSDLPEHRYFAARIDAPSIEVAFAMTARAKLISSPAMSMAGQCAYYDYLDPTGLPVDNWSLLVDAQLSPYLVGVNWCEFDSDVDVVTNAAFRFGTHALTGWNDGRLYGDALGAKVLAFNYNSYGATTVRSTTGEGGRYVPNALSGGYAAAIGATGEPLCCLGPMPEILMACLQEGWTLGESYFIASTFDDWMWTLVGDPLLRVPSWFSQVVPLIPGDLDGNGRVDGRDLNLFSNTYLSNGNIPGDWGPADLSQDGVIDDDDAFLMVAPLLYPGESPETVLRATGDLNGDDLINGLDLSLFVELMLAPDSEVPLRQRWGADMNRDGQNDLADLPFFVQKLIYHSPKRCATTNNS